MTERGRDAVTRTPDSFTVGPSGLHWDRNALTIEIEEKGDFIPRRVTGRVRLIPEALNTAGFALDPEGRHKWRAIAPRARIEVTMTRPELNWNGSAYWDSNQGTESLEQGFRDWQWSRAHLGREVAVIYEGARSDRSRFAAALRFGADGVPREEELPRTARLRPTLWAMPRRTRADDGRARVVKTWEDAPFYARSTIAARLFGEEVRAVHESLSLTRFATPVVQWMLPYRMPRRA